MSCTNTTDKIPYGSDFKMNVNMPVIGELHMSDVDFRCIFYAGHSDGFVIQKEDMIRIDDDNYVAPLHSTDLGKGRIFMTYEVDLPDADFESGIRHEVVHVKTSEEIA